MLNQLENNETLIGILDEMSNLSANQPNFFPTNTYAIARLKCLMKC